MLDLKLATHKHKDDLVRMALDFFRASPYAHLSVDTTKVTEIVNQVLESEDAIALLLVDGETVVGCLVGCLSEMIFSRQKIASEVVWWVEPSYRGHRVCLQMVPAFEWWAKRRGCSHVHMSLLADETGERLEKIYKRKGYANSERAYLKEL